MTNPYEGMSHGLIVSKLWLCEELEKILPKSYKSNVTVLGSWTNVISFLLVTRNASLYNTIHAYDIDAEAIEAANKICDTWRFEEPKIYNIVQDVNTVEHKNTDVVINCSVEHIQENTWFTNIPFGTLVCIQSSNVSPDNIDWNIVNYNASIEGLKQKYPLTRVLFSGIKEINYSQWGYERYMLIGYK